MTHGLVGYRQTPEHVAKRAGAIRRWTPARLWRLMGLLEAGRSDDEIGQALGCTANAANLARKAYGLRARHGALLSANAVALRMGVSQPTVTRWILRGWLDGKRGQAWGPHCEWFVHPDALEPFVEDARYWRFWDPRRVTDDGLRHTACMLRPAAFEPLLTTDAVAERLYMARHTVREAILAGRLPGLYMAGRWYVPEAALATYVPPPIGTPSRARDDRRAA